VKLKPEKNMTLKGFICTCIIPQKTIKLHKPCKMTAVSSKADGVWGDFSGVAKAQIATTVTPSR